MLRLDAERKEASRLLGQTGRKIPYPGVSSLMLRSISAGVMRFGGTSRNDPSQSLPVEPRLLSTAGSATRKGGPTMQFNYGNSLGRPMTGTSSPDQMFFDPDAFKVSDEDEKKEDLATPSNVDEPDPEPALVQKLTSQCNNLAWRLVAMEQELEQYRASAAEEPQNPFMNLHETATRPVSQATLRAASRQGGSRTSSPNRTRRKSRGDENAEEGEKNPLHPKLLPIEKSTNHLTELVTSLTKSLYGDDKAKSEEKEMNDALRAHAREQKRHEEYIAARIEWKKMHSAELQIVLKMEVQRQKKMEEKIESFKHMLADRKRQVFLQEWHSVMKDNLKERKRLIAAAVDMENRHFNTVFLSILKAWHKAAHGPYSRKGVMERLRIRMAEERVKLEKVLKERGEDVGLITKEMLVDEMRKSVVGKVRKERPRSRVSSSQPTSKLIHAFLYSLCPSQLEKQREARTLRLSLQGLSLAVQIAEDNHRESIRHYKNHVMQRVFTPWAEWAFLNSQGLDRARWKAPGKLVVRYNQTAVDAFSDRRVKKLFFHLWKPVAQRYVAAKKMRRRVISEFARRHLKEWKYVAIVQRKLMMRSVSEWKGYSRRIMESPFRMWFVWMDQRKRKRADQDRLITAYMRTKHRKFLWNIVRGWRHQAVYGRIAGLYSRNDLMKSLTEQKQQCKQMEQEMATYVSNVNEMNKLLEENTKRVKEMEVVLQKKENKARELRMAMHHCEQEMVKMQSLVESVQHVHPVVAKHIQDLQGTEFDFKFRGLNTLVALRKSEEETQGKETVLLEHEIEAEEFDDDGLLFKDDDGAGNSDDVEDGDEAVPAEVLTSGGSTGQGAATPSEPGLAQPNGIQPETSSSLVATDAAMNSRLQFVLGRGDYRGVLKLGGAALMQPNPTEDVKLSAEENEVVNSHILADEVVKLYGLIEFLRSGDVEALDNSEKAAWIESEKTAVSGERENAGEAKEKVEEEEVEEEGGKAGAEKDEEKKMESGEVSKTSGAEPMPEREHDANRKWKHLTNPATVTGEPYCWKDFMLAINRRLPQDRKTGTIQDKVMNRISAGKERNEQMLKSSSVQRTPAKHGQSGAGDDGSEKDKNLYTGKDFEDTFKPATPRRFDLG